MDWVTFSASGISQRKIPSTPPLLRCIRTTIWPLVLWKSNWLPLPGTRVPLGKNQFPMAGLDRQQAARLVMQIKASSSSPISSRTTILLFWYVAFLSENQTSPSPGKEYICHKIFWLQYLELSISEKTVPVHLFWGTAPCLGLASVCTSCSANSLNENTKHAA